MYRTFTGRAVVSDDIQDFLDNNAGVFGVRHRIDPTTGNVEPTGELLIHSLNGHDTQTYTRATIINLMAWYKRTVLGTSARVQLDEEMAKLGVGEAGQLATFNQIVRGVMSHNYSSCSFSITDQEAMDDRNEVRVHFAQACVVPVPSVGE